MRAHHVFLGLVAVACMTMQTAADVQEAVKKLVPSTVAVEFKVNSKSGEPKLDQPTNEAQVANPGNPLRDFQFRQDTTKAVTYASGTIVSDQGLIVTMLGDVGKGDLTVTFGDGKQSPAKLLVDDRRSGLQLIEVEDEEAAAEAVKFAEADVALGQQLATVICLDLHHQAAATGIVSAKERSIQGIAVPLLQTDVNIGSMSAGAPVADLSGNLVGIWIAREGQSPGVSFAIPVKFVKQMLEARDDSHHRVLERGYLGVSLGEAEKDQASTQIIQVGPDTPAQDAGLVKGDAIIKINQTLIRKPTDVVQAIGQHLANDEVELTIKRDGEEKQLTIKLEAFPKQSQKQDLDIGIGNIEIRQAPKFFGLDNSGQLRQYGLENGKVLLLGDMKPRLALDPSELKALTYKYQKAVENEGEVSAVLDQATIRVQRSNVEQKLSELTDRVGSLQSEVEKLTKELKSLGKSLDE